MGAARVQTLSSRALTIRNETNRAEAWEMTFLWLLHSPFFSPRLSFQRMFTNIKCSGRGAADVLQCRHSFVGVVEH